jgi:predicted nuclease of predicted toxin-antitoxin system
MRILLDEDLPRRLGALLIGHELATVQRRGWSGIKNG